MPTPSLADLKLESDTATSELSNAAHDYAVKQAAATAKKSAYRAALESELAKVGTPSLLSRIRARLPQVQWSATLGWILAICLTAGLAIGVATGHVHVPWPGPIPTPVPPVPPTPPPSPAPIPVAGFRVLIVYDSATLATLPKDQLNILYDRSIRDYLSSKCATGPDGKSKEYRFWPADTDPSGDEDLWKAALARPHQSLPWLIVSDGKTGFEGPLPANVADTLTLLKKYGN